MGTKYTADNFGDITAVGSLTIGSLGQFVVSTLGVVTAPSFIGPLTGHASLDLSLTGGTLTGLLTGTSITATTFTGALIGGASLDLPLTGGTLTGNLTAPTFFGNLTGNVTGSASLDLPLTGGTLTGALAGTTFSGDGSALTNLTPANIAAGTANISITGTAASASSVAANTLTGTTLASNVVTSSLTSLGTQASSLNMGSNQIINLADPSSAQGAATKNYVDSAIAGLYWKEACLLATTTTLPAYSYLNGSSGVGATITATATGAVTIDGTVLALTDRLLVKNEVGGNQPYNGIYTVTTAGAPGVQLVLTRAIDYDSTATINAGDAVFIESGTINATSAWVQTTVGPINVGVTDLDFVQFSGPGSYTAGTGLTLVGVQFSLTTPVTISDGGTGTAFTSQSFAFIGPSSGSGAPSFRALVASDIPTLNQNTTGSAATAAVATTADGLATSSTTVVVSGATAPTSGQVLTASSGTLASWVSPSAGGISALTGDVTASGSGSVVATAAATQPNITTLSNASGVSITGTNLTLPDLLLTTNSIEATNPSLPALNLSAYGGANAVRINSDPYTGTGGIAIFSGAGATPTQVASIDGSGNLSVSGTTSLDNGAITTDGSGDLQTTGVLYAGYGYSSSIGTNIVTGGSILASGPIQSDSGGTGVTRIVGTGVTQTGAGQNLVLTAPGGASITTTNNFSGTTISATTFTGALTGSATEVGGITVTGTPSSGQVLTATSTTAADWQTPSGGGASLSWTSYTLPYTSFTTGAPSASIFTLAAQEMVHAVVIKHSTAFTGGGLTGYTISVGPIYSVNKYASAFNVFQTVGSQAAQTSQCLFIEDFSSANVIYATAVATGAAVSAATAGSVTIWILTSTI